MKTAIIYSPHANLNPCETQQKKVQNVLLDCSGLELLNYNKGTIKYHKTFFTAMKREHFL